jgi:hypothetical protein
VKLHLFDNQDKHLADCTSLRIAVELIDTLYGRCQENGCVHPNGLLGSRPWGIREFSIIDPSGVCVTFVVGPANPQKPCNDKELTANSPIAISEKLE